MHTDEKCVEDKTTDAVGSLRAASKVRHLKRGVKEVVKSVRKGEKG